MKSTLRSHHTTLAELNITPMLDLVFVLLVIFIITTPQLLNNLELALPSAKNDAAKPAEPAHIRVLRRDQIQLEMRRLTLAELKSELAARKAAQPDLAVILEGANRAEYQAIVDVLEAIQQLNITQVGLATASGDTPPDR